MTRMTISQKVEREIEALRGMNNAARLAWAKINGMDSRAGFAAFKKALAAHGIDYDAERRDARQEQAATLAAATAKSVTLFSDAKAKNDRFAICDAAGRPLWHGRFFDGDRDYDGEQSSGEMAAAKKAVWLASKIAEAAGVSAIALTLKVDAEWLVWANEAMRPDWDGKTGGKAAALAAAAKRLNVALKVEHVRGLDNPADRYTVEQGFQKWSDNDLAALAV